MNRIYKYELEITDHQTIEMPSDPRFLQVKIQSSDKLCVWALVDPDAESTLRDFLIIGTGHDINIDLRKYRYLDTVMMADGALVWHVFVMGR